jgi:predicted thioredoxin/glutaredoxin
MVRGSHKIELFTDGDPMSWRISVIDASKVLKKAEKLGIRSLPAIVIDGKLFELNVEVKEEELH